MKNLKQEALWSHVHWLGALSTWGSFTAAAQQLGVSKAAMSQRIASLEQAAGVPLVRRTTRSVRLTEAGQQLVDSTRAAFEQIENSLANVKDMSQAPRGLLRVTAPVALGRQRIVPLIPAFLKQFPEVRIELELTDRIASLVQDGFEIAIRHATTVPDTHVAWKLCESRVMLVASRGYLKLRGKPAEPGDLAEHDCLHYPRSGGARCGPSSRQKAVEPRSPWLFGARLQPTTAKPCAKQPSGGVASPCCRTSAHTVMWPMESW